VDDDRGLRDLPPVLDAAQVARLLQLNIDYVRKLSRSGVLPAHKLPGGRTFRYLKDEVLEWLRVQPVGDPTAADREADAGRSTPERSRT